MAKPNGFIGRKPARDIVAGDYVICRLDIVKVLSVQTFAAGMHHAPSVRPDYPATRIETTNGERWKGADKLTNVYDIDDAIAWRRECARADAEIATII